MSATYRACIFAAMVALLLITLPLSAQETGPFAHFEVDEVHVDRELGVVFAWGNVQVAQDQRALSADAIRYDQRADILVLLGNVSLWEPSGGVIVAEFMMLDGDLKLSIVQDLLTLVNKKFSVAAPSEESRANQYLALIDETPSGGPPRPVADREGPAVDTIDRVNAPAKSPKIVNRDAKGSAWSRLFSPPEHPFYDRNAKGSAWSRLFNPPENPFYVGVGGGTFNRAMINSAFYYSGGIVNSQERRFHDGRSASLKVGYRGYDHLRGELEFIRSEAKLKQLSDFLTGDVDIIIPGYPGRLKTDTVIVNTYWDIDKYDVGSYAVTPYIGGGFGVTFIDYEQAGRFFPEYGFHILKAFVKERELAMNLTLGFRAWITPTLSFSQEYTRTRVFDSLFYTTDDGGALSPGNNKLGYVDAYSTADLIWSLEHHFGGRSN